MDFEIIRISEKSEMKEKASSWFHEKWGIPKNAYLESMEEAIKKESPYPEWYLAVENGEIIGGLGVIENDFHDRKDLFPNVCAVYTEKGKRNRGVAGKLLKFVCEDMKERGINTLYLITNHTSFYERYGWRFFCMAQGDGEEEMTRLYIHKE